MIWNSMEGVSWPVFIYKKDDGIRFKNIALEFIVCDDFEIQNLSGFDVLSFSDYACCVECPLWMESLCVAFMLRRQPCLDP